MMMMTREALIEQLRRAKGDIEIGAFNAAKYRIEIVVNAMIIGGWGNAPYSEIIEEIELRRAG